MDKASDFESEDCEFESRRGQYFNFYSSWLCSQDSLVVVNTLIFIHHGYAGRITKCEGKQ